ncbi:FAD-dependent oxidoreductase [Kitasatospora sp. NPDC093806]|uniref:NAD(P)/FAD-dependent oxidoreductase n=1 Tax=Kitasatospora sp. NPDC093806 TaxID=3155075 RepID=UPI0034251A91
MIATANHQETLDAIDEKSEIGGRATAIIVDSQSIDPSFSDFAKEIHERRAGIPIAILADGKITIHGLDGKEPLPVQKALISLANSWRPEDPQVTVSGPADSVKMNEIRGTLERAGFQSDFVAEPTSEPTVKIKGCDPLINPTKTDLLRAFNIISSPTNGMDHRYDLVIIGAGPAGLSAALAACVNVGLSTLVIESNLLGGTATTSINPIDNYLGFPQGISGPRLARLAVQQIRVLNQTDFRLDLRAQCLRKDERNPGRYIIEVSSERGSEDVPLSAGMILLACGLKPRDLPLAKGSHIPDRGVYYSALPCDRYHEKDNSVVIFGGGDSAGRAALLFSKESRVSVVATYGFNRMSLRLQRDLEDARIATYKTHRVAGFVGDHQLSKVILEDVSSAPPRTLPIAATSAYILIGGTPDTKWLCPNQSGRRRGELKIDRDRSGYIKTDIYLRPYGGKLPFETSLPGVFAAGDVRVNSLRRVGQAVGQGVAAVASMERYAIKHPGILDDEDSPAYSWLRH